MPPDQPSAAGSASEVDDSIEPQELSRVMRVVPLGAGILAGGAVALLVLGYLAVYLLEFITRGSVG